MVTTAQLEETARHGLAALDALLLDPLAGLPDWPRVRVSAADAARLAQGQAVRVTPAPAAGRIAVVDAGPRLLGLAEAEIDGVVRPRRWLV